MTSLINSGAKVLLFLTSARDDNPYYDELQDLGDRLHDSKDELNCVT